MSERLDLFSGTTCLSKTHKFRFTNIDFTLIGGEGVSSFEELVQLVNV